MEPPDALPAGTVMVPLDGSELAELAIDPAKVLASHLGVSVGVVMVVGDASKADTKYLDRVVEQHGLDWQLVEVHDDVAEGIHIAATGRAALLCMATHGHGRAGSVFGSTAQEVLARSTSPIALAGRGGDARRFRHVHRIVVPLDGTDDSEAVCAPALRLASQLGASVELVTVAAEPMESLHDDQPPRRRFGPQDPDAYMADAVGRWSTGDVAVTGEVIIDPISPASGLGQWLRERPNGLLAMATHGRTGLQRLLHGSVSASVLGESPVPALMIAITQHPGR
jgi:nucleotide-binding universal stress UspA family protein